MAWECSAVSSHAQNGVEILVPIGMRKESIRKAFQRVANKLEFCVIDRGENYLTAVYYNKFLLQKVFCCFNGMLGMEEMTGIKLLIQTEEQSGQRRVLVKCLSEVALRHKHRATLSTRSSQRSSTKHSKPRKLRLRVLVSALPMAA